MQIQGWGLPLPATAGANGAGSPEQDCMHPLQKLPSKVKMTAPPHDPTRLELLASIKKRIKSGFYNSEMVLEDLSDGFAQALDPTT
jgi:hypothetical protein